MGGIWPDFLTALILVGIGWSCSLLLLDRETIPRLLSSLNLGRLLHLSLESSDLGIWCYEHQQDRIFLDGRACLLLGLPTRAARLAEFLECVVPEDRERIRRIWLHPPTTAAPGTVEFRVGDSHRGLRHLSLSSGLPGRGGKRRRRSGAMAMGTLQDVTERKKVEIALRESEARFSTIFRTCPAGIALCRVADGFLVDVNPAFLHIYGLERQEVIGMTSFALHLWGSPQQREVALASILIDGRGYQSERSIRRPDGQVRHLLISVDLVFLDSERYLQWTLLDVTENRRSQALASRNEILTNAIMNSLDVAVAVLDREGNILRTNRKWSEFALGNGAGVGGTSPRSARRPSTTSGNREGGSVNRVGSGGWVGSGNRGTGSGDWSGRRALRRGSAHACRGALSEAKGPGPGGGGGSISGNSSGNGASSSSGGSSGTAVITGVSWSLSEQSRPPPAPLQSIPRQSGPSPGLSQSMASAG